MRPILRLAAGAAILLAVGSMSAPLASAGTCTPIDNRIAARIAVAPRTSTQIITAPSPDVPKTTVDGATVVSHVILTDLGTVRSVKVKDISLSHTNLSDITLRLRAPDGSLVLLANSLAGANMTGTTFATRRPASSSDCPRTPAPSRRRSGSRSSSASRSPGTGRSRSPTTAAAPPAR